MYGVNFQFSQEWIFGQFLKSMTSITDVTLSLENSKKSTIIDHLKEVHGKFDGFHNIIHIGGDEVPHDGATVIWESSPICQKFIQEVC